VNGYNPMSSDRASADRWSGTRIARVKDLIPIAILASLIAIMPGIANKQAALLAPAAAATVPADDTCSGGKLVPGDPDIVPDPAPDLIVTKACAVPGGPAGVNKANHYYYHNVHILDGGSLNFADAQIDFWASSMLVENAGSLIAGSPTQPIGQVGRGSNCSNNNDITTCTNSGVLTIHLYGKSTDPDIACRSGATCGVPEKIWTNNGFNKFPFNNLTLPGKVNDYFYGYNFMPNNMPPHDKGFFGNKVLAVSYNGTLQLYGMKGALLATSNVSALNSGMSWARLTQTVNNGDSLLVLDRQVDWQYGDQIVLTTTDYLASHSEQLTIASVDNSTKGISKITLSAKTPVQWTHSGSYYSLNNVDPTNRLQLNITITDGITKGVETRAAVALLSRSIRIVSGGNTINTDLPAGHATVDSYYGGHTIVRQGFADYEMQGVELYQLGHGGSIGHYPVHFHLARVTAPATKTDGSARETFVKDCSIWDSMTRFITLHATQDVTLARNVGYESIGHGFYLEDGSEIDNKLYSNIGILARAGVINATQNPRFVPGILARDSAPGDSFPFRSDWEQPTLFWIMNGWNDIQGNMAAGADTCGACYWWVPGQNSGFSSGMKWDGYAAIQQGRALTSPLQQFYQNYCTSAMNSFVTLGATNTCNGVGDPNPADEHLVPIPNAEAAKILPGYFPTVNGTGGRLSTRCPAGKNCADTVAVPTCSAHDTRYGNGQKGNCMVTVIDHYTTSFNYAETNLAAVWLRPQWYLFLNSAITDVLNGGLTFVTGGGFTRSDAIEGYWSLARKSVFIGNTQTNNPYAANDGPFNPGGLKCDTRQSAYQARPGNYCLSAADGMSMQLSNFGVNQRLFNIYDGPSYQDSNAYLDIAPTYLSGCDPTMGPCLLDWMVGGQPGVLRDPTKTPSSGQCYLPNAAIAWKQPNGFYYPPAFHSTNLLFSKVPIRHFVIEPLLDPGTYKTDVSTTTKLYCSSPGNTLYFEGFTDIDRQTELNDDDGSLTGLVNTISVNEDPFFNAPTETAECASNVGIGASAATPVPTSAPSPTAKTSPYDYVTTVVYPGCAQDNTCNDDQTDPKTNPNYGHGGDWSRACAGPYCYGIPIYREFLNPGETQAPYVRMAGQSSYQRSTMTLNNSTYYIDTTVSKETQNSAPFTNSPAVRSVNVFLKGHHYYLFWVYAKNTTNQTYQIYVGPGFNVATDLHGTRVDVTGEPYKTHEIALSDADWLKNPTVQNGMLTVMLNLSGHATELNPGTPPNQPLNSNDGLCKPSSFCDWNGNSCACSASAADYPLITTDATFQSECNAVCKTWAVKDLDCPSGGCFGLAINLPDSLQPAATPTPSCFPQSVFNVPFVAPTPAAVAGDCAYNNGLPQAKFCN